MRTMVRTGSSHIGTIRARTPRRAEVVGDRAQALPRGQAAGALDVGGQIGVAEAEPGLAAQLRERRHEGPGLAGASPAGLRIGDARERVHDGIQIRRDAEPEMLEVVAGVAHHHQGIRRQQPVETERELGAADAAGQRDHAHCRAHRKRSSSGSRTRADAGSGGHPTRGRARAPRAGPRRPPPSAAAPPRRSRRRGRPG